VISQRASGSSERFQNVRKSVVGVIFFGTPHAGSALGEWGQQIRSIASIAASTNPNILAPLDTNVDNGQLEELRDEFNKMLGTAAEGKFSVHSFREMKAPVPIPHTPGNNLVGRETTLIESFLTRTSVGCFTGFRSNKQRL
jgi:hypothetical protein